MGIFDKLQQLKQLKQMRDDAMRIQKSLDEETINVEKHGVQIQMTLAQRIVSVQSNGRGDDDIRDAVNEAIKESQKEAAKKMQSMVGFEGLKGMFGGGS